MSWDIDNGEDIRFWQDIWIPNCDKLSSYSLTTISEEDANLALSHFTTYSGEWNWDIFEDLLPNDIVQKLQNFPPPSALNHDDDYKWGATPDVSFTTKSAYLIQQTTNSNNNNLIFNLIWKWKGKEMICFFYGSFNTKLYLPMLNVIEE